MVSYEKESEERGSKKMQYTELNLESFYPEELEIRKIEERVHSAQVGGHRGRASAAIMRGVNGQAVRERIWGK